MKGTPCAGWDLLTAFSSVVEQPLKTPFVAGTVLYANAEKGDVGRTVVQRIAPLLKEAADAGEWREFKLLLRLLACLGPLFEENGVMAILDELFNRAVDLQTASSDDVSLAVPLLKGDEELINSS